MSVELTITQEDLDKGQRMRSSSCPVALAANRTFGGRWSVGVDSLIDLKSMSGYKMGSDMFVYVTRYDCGCSVPLATFTLEEPWISPLK